MRDHVRFHLMRTEPACHPETIAAGFEGKHILRPVLTASSRQRCSRLSSLSGTRLQLLARLTLNPGKHTGNQPTRLAHFDDDDDRAILVQGDEGSAQSLPWRKPGSFGWGKGTPSVR